MSAPSKSIVANHTEKFKDVLSVLTPDGNLLRLEINKAEALSGGASAEEDVAPAMLSALDNSIAGILIEFNTEDSGVLQVAAEATSDSKCKGNVCNDRTHNNEDIEKQAILNEKTPPAARNHRVRPRRLLSHIPSKVQFLLYLLQHFKCLTDDPEVLHVLMLHVGTHFLQRLVLNLLEFDRSTLPSPGFPRCNSTSPA